uniref:Uncharacterized protein n=1 Tax=viral metagenome TaxID=1070528 RepID=A0A6H1ZMK8_9ZZZZ
MPKASTKHSERIKVLSFDGFSGGGNLDQDPTVIPITQLSRFKNVKFAKSFDESGNPVVSIKPRQGVNRITPSALPGGATVTACTKYINANQYILAGSDSTLYYVDDSTTAPVSIGTIEGIPRFTEFNQKLIIHDGGVTKSWNDSTFETLDCRYEDEVLATGDSTVLTYSGTITNIPIDDSSVTITYTSGGVTKTITDTGVGGLTGDCNDSSTINYTTGAYVFTVTDAPDGATSLLAEYDKDGGAPRSKDGMIRGGRLYIWGDSTNSSRLYYSSSEDEEAWDTSSGGGEQDCDPDDGYELVGVLNYFQSLLLIKENSLHRLDNFPGDSTFRIEPLDNKLGSVAYRTCLSDGNIISFLETASWSAMESTERYGDIQKTVPLSKHFSNVCKKYADGSAYSEFNKTDKQLWLTLYDADNSAYLSDIYVINLDTGGQLSLYEFSFGHTCYKYVNGEMLIGGSDGHLYRLDDTESVFKDDGVSYSDSTVIRTAFTDFGLAFLKKHTKEIGVRAAANVGMTATINLYVDRKYTVAKSLSLSLYAGDASIFDDGQGVYIYDMTTPILASGTFLFKHKITWKTLMVEIKSIYGLKGFEIFGIDTQNALVGDR